MNSSGRRSPRLVLALLFMGALGILLWHLLPSSEPLHAVDPLFEQVPAELVPLLAAESDSGLLAWVREAGFEVTRQAAWYLSESASRLPPDEFTRRQAEIEGYQKRFARLLAREFDGQYYVDKLDFVLRHSPTEQQHLLTRRGRIHYLIRQSGVSAEQKIDTLTVWLAEAEQDGDSMAIANCLFGLSGQYARREERQKQREYLDAALEIFLRQGAHMLACQALGVLGDLHERAGDYDAMVQCYEQARQLAKRGRIPEQAGRINAFYAAHYRQMGNLALAHELYHEAMRSCREFKGQGYEIRYVCTAMDFYADLSAWDIVEGLLDRAKDLMVLYADDPYTARFTNSVVQAEARWAMAHGRVERGDELFRELSLQIGDGWSPVPPVENYRLWARGLMENGRYQEAAHVALTGRNLAEGYLLPGHAARLTLLRAWAEFGGRRLEAAGDDLALFDRLVADGAEVPDEELISRDELSARMALAQGDTTGAIRDATLTMNRLVRVLNGMHPSTHSYLWIESCDGVRQLWHELAAGDPWAGYGLELFWRDLGRALQGSERSGSGPGGGLIADEAGAISLAGLSGLGHEAADHIRQAGAWHCQYAVVDGGLRRWTVTPDTLRSEALPLGRADCEDLVRRARDLMHGSGGTGDALPAREALRELSAAVLPASVTARPAASSPHTLLVTPSGPLALLPFEALDMSDGDAYRPLLAAWDVAYLRRADAGPPGSTAIPGLVVANSEIQLEAGQQSPFAPRLAEVGAEGRAVAAHDPHIRMLEERSATKPAVQRLWEGAGFLYFATHIARDPRAPYLATIPLAAPDSLAGLEAMHLGLEDIRRAHLDACRLVVLSGCESGLPYITSFTAGPSLGDAFLDAGADAVVETLWDVPDTEARRTMIAFTDRWLQAGEPVVHALAATKRAAFRETGGRTFDWATYVVEVSSVSDLN